MEQPRNYAFEIAKHQENNGMFEGYASVFGTLDHHRDVVVRGAFFKTLRAWKLAGKMPKMLWQHEPQAPIGIWTDMREDQRGLWVKGQLALETQKGREAYHLLKMGAIDGLSIGFRAIKAAKDPTRKARLIQDVDLIEVSLVTFAANGLASVECVKGRPGIILR